MIDCVTDTAKSSQIASVSNITGTQNNDQTSKTETYEQPTVSFDEYSIYGKNYPKDEFEQNLSSDDLKYFVFTEGGTYRFPNVGVSPQLKQQWLAYSKEMAAKGFTPEDVLQMNIGSS
ncbi:MAG: hypothetical protein K0R55_4629, partial [Sporomusa sp.]|nr:hypothetical protein [Sporomusa sp.]